MITAHVDLAELDKELKRLAADFGEANESGIARWGVAVCRRLITTTQVFGDGKAAKEKQEKAMLKDLNNAFVVVEKPELVRRLKQKKLTGLYVKGQEYTFRPYQQITTGDGVNQFIEANRKAAHKRVPKLPPGMRCVTSAAAVRSAMAKRKKRVFKGKGGWVGAGQMIGSYQKTGSRITIGKNFGGVAHRWKSGGTASMKKNTWDPEGTITNNFQHVTESYVLAPSDMQKAIIDGGKNTITWYEKVMNARLNRRKS